MKVNIGDYVGFQKGEPYFTQGNGIVTDYKDGLYEVTMKWEITVHYIQGGHTLRGTWTEWIKPEEIRIITVVPIPIEEL